MKQIHIVRGLGLTVAWSVLLTGCASYRLTSGVPEELRSVFILKYAHDLSHREIGALLHITENNVTVRLHRARGKIAEILRREGYAVEK